MSISVPSWRFLDRSEAMDLQTREGTVITDDVDERRKRIVEMEMSQAPAYFPDRLRQWMNRFALREKKVTAVRVEYRIIRQPMEHIHRLKEMTRSLLRRYGHGRQVGKLGRLLKGIRRPQRLWCANIP